VISRDLTLTVNLAGSLMFMSAVGTVTASITAFRK
jgi:hypothetical protein